MKSNNIEDRIGPAAAPSVLLAFPRQKHTVITSLLVQKMQMKASLQSLKSSKGGAELLMQGPKEETHVPIGCTNLSLLGKHRKSPPYSPTSS
jgi:hypothetical protein